MVPAISSTVLLIDDDGDTRRVVRRHLERHGLQVIELATGIGAEGAVTQKSVDVVVTDLVMPEREGLDTVRALRGRFPSLPILVLTGSSFGDLALRAGATEVFRKPFSSQALADSVLRMVGRPSVLRTT
jgi:CheY-like chemotaxis protein